MSVFFATTEPGGAAGGGSREVIESLALFSSGQDAIRRAGEAKLKELAQNPLSDGDIDLLLDTALTVLPEIEGDTVTPQSTLLYVLRGQQSAHLVDAIKSRFSKFEADLQEEAVSVLVRIDSPNAIDAVVELVCSGKTKETISFEWDAEGALPDNPSTRVSHLIQLVGCAADEVVRDNLLMATLYRLQSLKEPADALDGLRALSLAEFRRNASKLAHSQVLTTNSLRSTNENFALRRRIGLLLDIFGYLPDSATLAILRDSLKLSDPRHRALALLSLVRRGQDVSIQDAERVAVDVDIRAMVYDALKSLDKLSLLPGQYRNQEALAFAGMAEWLRHPNELNQSPDEIELVKLVSVKDEEDGKTYEFYVFRFRTFEPHWAAKDGWMFGVAGPYDQGEEPRWFAPFTFSGFESWNALTPEAIVEQVIATLPQVE